MKKILTATACLLIATATAQQSERVVPGQVLLALHRAEAAQYLFESLPAGIKPAHAMASGMGLWVMQFDTNQYTLPWVLELLQNHPHVAAVQANHRLALRSNTPNDSLFAMQYSLLNTGQTGGSSGADIKATQAWDISTGGVTRLGDTVVIGIVDGGMDINHPDLQGNLHVNRAEIPGNNTDDDGNGYKDDYRGLDVPAGTDDLVPMAHGTEVMGIIGARGNNKTGVAGINWNVKLLPVGCFTNTESSVVEAYAYLLMMRRLYHKTNGSKGAFVVCVNSSFGYDFGKPSDFPLWCSMYDSLGKAGIISVASTSNIHQDVDASNDIPTSCASRFLVMVTNTDHNDAKPFASGYGKNSVDLAAPGEYVLTTTLGTGYSTPSGTSFASPQVAGVVGLMFSAACKAYMLTYLTRPDSVAEDFISILLNGTDPLTNLASITKSRGRLNAFKPLSYLDNMNCTIAVLPAQQPATRLYPNPASGAVHVETALPGPITLTDLTGKTMMTNYLQPGNHSLQLAGLPTGVYVVNLPGNHVQRLVLLP